MTLKGHGLRVTALRHLSINGRRWLTRGGVFSSYALQRSSCTRLPDAWRCLPRRPALPAWTGSHIEY